MYEYLNRIVCSNQDRTECTSVKSTIISQQCLHLLQNIIPLNPRSREFGQNSFSGMVQYKPTYRGCRLGHSAWCTLAALSCTTDFQSASAVVSAGLHDFLTSIPSIISFGPTSNSPVSQQFAVCCKKKLPLFLKSSRVKSCVAQMTISRFVGNKYRGADKFLARPGRKEATATEVFDFHISYL
jgi:hypothetical protein